MSYTEGLVEERNYIYQDGYFTSILSVFVPYGRGVNLEINDVIRLFDTVVFDGVEISYVTKHQKMSGRHFDSLIDQFRNTTIMESNLSVSKGESEAVGSGGSDDIGNTIKVKKTQHRKAYQQAQADKGTAAVYRWDFKLRCLSAELLDKQLQAFKDNYDGIADGENSNKKLQDVLLVPYTGKQLQAVNDLFTQLNEHDEKNGVSTQDNYSGLDIYVSTSLIDDNGVPVGYDIHSKQNGRVFIDFVGSTVKNGVIAIPQSQSVSRFKNKDTGKKVSSASILSQTVANQFALEGRKVAHLILNDYDYLNTTNAYFTGYQEAFEKVDMSLVSINPLQLEGRREDQPIIYQNIQDKLALIMNILLDFTLDTAGAGSIKNAVSDVLSKGFWSDNATLYPLKGKLVGQMRETFPLVGNVITSLKREMSSTSVANTDAQIDRLNTLIGELERALANNKNLIGRATNLPQITKPQTYYEFRNVGADKFKMVQFVNILNNLSQMLSRGDLLVIHGVQVLDTRIFTEYIKAELEEVYKKGVRVLFSFDTTSTPHNSSIFTLGNGGIYHSFSVDVDWSFIGHITDDHFPMLEKLYAKQMTAGMRADLVTSNIEGRGVFYRGATKTLHFVDLLPII